MKRIVVSLVVASVAFLNTFGQGIENKLWVAKVEQGDNIILANEGIAMFYLNSLSKEYVIAPLDDSIEYSSGTYSISQSGSKYTLRLLTGFVLSGAKYEITLQTDRKGTFLFTTPLAGLFQRGSLELWADCSGGFGIPNEKRTDYIVTIPENFNTHFGTASKISWNGDEGCFQTLTIDDLDSDGTHFDRGTISSITGEKTQTVLFSGEQENFSVNLEYLCDTIGNFDAFFPRNPIHSHSGVFIIVPDLEIISDFEDLDQYFSPLPCDELKITTHPQSQQIKDGATLVLNVAVTSEADYTVHWYRDGIPLGRTGNTLQITNFRQTNAGDYWAIAKNFAGEDRSNTATVAWEPAGNPPEFTIQPISQQIQEGESLTLTVDVVSTEGYDTIWYKDETPLGATGTTLNISSVSKNDEGRYWAVASNPYGQARSAIANIDIIGVPVAPTFIAHPESQVITTGQSITLSVEVLSDDPYTLQWFKDGNSVQSEDEVLILNDAQLGDSGNYWAIASNSNGSIKSDIAVVSVIPDADRSKIYYADEFSFSMLPTWQEVQTGEFYNSLIGPPSPKGSPMLNFVPDLTSGEGLSLQASTGLFVDIKFSSSDVIDEGNAGDDFYYSFISYHGENYLVSSVKLDHEEGDKYLHGYCYIPDITVYEQTLSDITAMLNGIVTNFNQERVSFTKVFYPNQDDFLDGYRTVITWIGNGGIFGGTYKINRDSADEFFISDGETFIHIPTFTSVVRDGVTLDVVHSRDGFDDRVLYVSPSMDLAYGNVTLEVDDFSYGPVSWKWTPSEGMTKLFPTNPDSFKRWGTYNLLFEPAVVECGYSGEYCQIRGRTPALVTASGLPDWNADPRSFDWTQAIGSDFFNLSTNQEIQMGIYDDDSRRFLMGKIPKDAIFPKYMIVPPASYPSRLPANPSTSQDSGVVVGRITRPQNIIRDGAIWTTYAGGNWASEIIPTGSWEIDDVWGVSPDGTYIYGWTDSQLEGGVTSFIAYDPSARWVPINWGKRPHQSVISHGLELRRNLQTNELTLSVGEDYFGQVIILERSGDVRGNWESLAGPLVYPSPDFFNIKLVSETGHFRVREIPAE